MSIVCGSEMIIFFCWKYEEHNSNKYMVIILQQNLYFHTLSSFYGINCMEHY